VVGVNNIHPTAVVSGDVQLGKGNTIGPFAVLTAPLVIGDDNWIGSGVVLGAPPEVRDWEHPRDVRGFSSGNGIVIGSRNRIREYAQVHQGWHDVTHIGDDGFIMNQSYVAHDCSLGDGVTLASSVLLAGHVEIGDFANLGLGAVVHQRRKIGVGSMVGMGSVVTRDLPPFSKAFGNPARIQGVNRIGMQRLGISAETIDATAAAYAPGVGSEALSGLEQLPDLAATFAAWLRRD
jgi:UDP-N-acetylglucosamine acyltransferase